MRGIHAAPNGQWIYGYDHCLDPDMDANRIQAVFDFIFGLYYRFPLCCVWAYCKDSARGYSPGIRREYEVPGMNRSAGYIRCIPCARAEEGA